MALRVLGEDAGASEPRGDAKTRCLDIDLAEQSLLLSSQIVEVVKRGTGGDGSHNPQRGGCQGNLIVARWRCLAEARRGGSGCRERTLGGGAGGSGDASRSQVTSPGSSDYGPPRFHSSPHSVRHLDGGGDGDDGPKNCTRASPVFHHENSGATTSQSAQRATRLETVLASRKWNSQQPPAAASQAPLQSRPLFHPPSYQPETVLIQKAMHTPRIPIRVLGPLLRCPALLSPR